MNFLYLYFVGMFFVIGCFGGGGGNSASEKKSAASILSPARVDTIGSVSTFSSIEVNTEAKPQTSLAAEMKSLSTLEGVTTAAEMEPLILLEGVTTAAEMEPLILLEGVTTAAKMEPLALMEGGAAASKTFTDTQTSWLPLVLGNEGILSSSELATTHFTVSWMEASGGESPLQYTVYYSTAQRDVASLAAVGGIQNTTPAAQGFFVIPDGGTSQVISSLAPSTNYYVNLVVTDSLGQKSLYAGGMVSTPAPAPPTVSSGALSIPAGKLGATSLVLSWTPATPGAPSDTLSYSVYYTTAAKVVDNMDDLSANISNTNAALFVLSNLKTTTATITDLIPNTTYYLNVTATDLFGHVVLYTMTSAVTTDRIYLFASNAAISGRLGGRLGADSICRTKKSGSYDSLPCNYIHAFLSVDQNDYLGNFPTMYGVGNGSFPASVPIWGVNGSVAFASSWSSLLNLQQSANFDNRAALGLGSNFNQYWTGRSPPSLNNSGGYNSCRGWMTDDISSGDNGGVGLYSNRNGFPFQYAGIINCSASTQVDILCVCW